MRNPWKTQTTRLVYKNPWIRVREDQVIRPDGKPGIYGVVEISPSVAVVALNDSTEVVLVGQWRYTHHKYSWEIPSGAADEQDALSAHASGPNPEAQHTRSMPDVILRAAHRELEEEAGVLAQNWAGLGTVDNSNGVTTDVTHLFLATELTIHPPQPEPEEDLVQRWVPLQEAVEMVLKGEITESGSVAALLKVNHYINHQGGI